jgi:hypothetical protein
MNCERPSAVPPQGIELEEQPATPPSEVLDEEPGLAGIRAMCMPWGFLGF